MVCLKHNFQNFLQSQERISIFDLSPDKRRLNSQNLPMIELITVIPLLHLTMNKCHECVSTILLLLCLFYIDASDLMMLMLDARTLYFLIASQQGFRSQIPTASRVSSALVCWRNERKKTRP